MSRKNRVLISRLALATVATALLPSFAHAQDVLLVPRFGTTVNPAAVAAFSAFDGSLINDKFIPADGRMRQPINVISSGLGTLLVSDTLADSIFEYGLDGQFLRTVTNTALSGIDAPKGIEVRNGEIFVVVSAGAYADSVQRIDLQTGGRLGTFAAGFTNGQDIHFRANDALLSDFDSDDILRYDLNGVSMGNLVTSDAVTGIANPYQIQSEPNGNLLVGSFSNTGAVYQYDANGTQLATFGNGFVRGGYRLDNGNLFYTQNNAVTLVDATTNGLSNVVGAGNWQFVERVAMSPIPEPGTLALLGLGVLPALRRRRR